jgi:hypothetical protein
MTMERFTGPQVYPGESIRRGNLIATIHFDYMVIEPWKAQDGVGIISEWTRRGKNPGERVLCTDRGSSRYYDVAATVAIAKRDGWSAGEGTPGERAARAVAADFDRWRQWCADQWCYVGVVITDRDDNNLASTWMIESDCVDYINEVTDDLFSEAREQMGVFKSRRVRESVE